MEEQSQSINFGEWYNSTQGPGISKTLVAIAGSILPVAFLVFGYKTGSTVDDQTVRIFSDNVTSIIYFVVYIFFAIRAAIGYVKSKQLLQAKLNTLQSRLYASNHSTGSTQGCDCCKHG